MAHLMDFRIGILGGGTGKNAGSGSQKLNFAVSVLDPTPECPAYSLVDRHDCGRILR